MGDNKDDNLMRIYPVVCPEIAASQTVEGRVITCHLFNPAFAEGERGCF